MDSQKIKTIVVKFISVTLFDEIILRILKTID